MDIRAIIDAEDTPPSRKQSASSPGKQDPRTISKGPVKYRGQPAPAYDSRRDIRPPQPSPLQTQSQNESHYSSGSSQNLVRSPFTPSTSFNSSQYPQIPSQSPAYGSQSSQYVHRESHPAPSVPATRSYGHSTPLTQTPSTSTPGSASAYSNFARPTSSHSVQTPGSAQHPSDFLGESPQPSYTQYRTSSQPQPLQQYVSQPSTPLGPPSTYGRSSFHLHRESPGGYEHHRTLSGGSYGQQQVIVSSPGTVSHPLAPAPASRNSQPSSIRNFESRGREQSLSVSPKTRVPSMTSLTSVASHPRQAETWNEQIRPTINRAESDTLSNGSAHDLTLNRRSSRVDSLGINGLLNAEPPLKAFNASDSVPSNFMSLSDTTNLKQATSQVTSIVHPDIQSEGAPSMLDDSSNQQTSSKHQSPTPSDTSRRDLNSGSSFPMRPQIPASDRTQTTSLQIDNDSFVQHNKKRLREETAVNGMDQQTITGEESTRNDGTMQNGPMPKKARFDSSQNNGAISTVVEAEPSRPANVANLVSKPARMKITHVEDIPIWAHSIKGPDRTWALYQRNKQLGSTGQKLPLTSQKPPNGTMAAPPSNQIKGKQGLNGISDRSTAVHIPTAQPIPEQNGPLGPWEPSILNIIPSEELVRVVSDWLFEHVVARDDVGVAPAGGAAGQGAVLEIEAKIGQLIDKNTNDRLRLPVLNECVVSHTDPNLRIVFKSSMTEAQHRTLNQFLNKALVDSQPTKALNQAAISPPTSRIPMSYKHTYETDTFYELSQAGALTLPQSVAASLQINPRNANKSKVRITTDQKTGKDIAKIIKARVADIDIYSPRTQFDWRISVNVEMDFNDDVSKLTEPERRDGKKSDRNKDRMSYKHLAYQIDLTQVTPDDATSKFSKEHELEIEVSSAEVRRQGKLAMTSQPNQYEQLIRGFIDNVRVLARHCKE